MSTPTYSSPIQSFWHTFVLDPGAAEFAVFELVPPPGQRLIICAFEGSTTTTTRFRVGVYGATNIVGTQTTVSVITSNPAGFAAIARTGVRADIGLFGYMSAPAFRQPSISKDVVDSIAGQRWCAISQVVDEPAEVSVRGYITAAEFDVAGRLLL